MKIKLNISGLVFLFAAGIAVQYTQNASASRPEPPRPISPEQFHHDTYPVSSMPLTRPQNPIPPSPVSPFSLEDSLKPPEILRPETALPSPRVHAKLSLSKTKSDNETTPKTSKPKIKPKPKSPAPSAASVSPPPLLSTSESALTPKQRRKRNKSKKAKTQLQRSDNTLALYQQMHTPSPDSMSPSRNSDSDLYFNVNDEFENIDPRILAPIERLTRGQQKQDKKRSWNAGSKGKTPPAVISYSPPSPPLSLQLSYMSISKNALTPPASTLKSPEKKVPTPPPSRIDTDISDIVKTDEDSYGPLIDHKDSE